jgi:hypothetical protein
MQLLLVILVLLLWVADNCMLPFSSSLWAQPGASLYSGAAALVTVLVRRTHILKFDE